MKVEDKIKQEWKNNKTNKLIKSLVVGMFVLLFIFFAGKDIKAETMFLHNPTIVSDSNMKSGQVVTYDCVWFGSYPQAEVITAEMNKNYTALSQELRTTGDVIISDMIYKQLQNATGWNSNGDIVIDGSKYRRIKKSDAIFTSDSNNYYNWSDDTSYHYFKYQPIKWRVLSSDGKQVFLLADQVLDAYCYHAVQEAVTWETCTMRSWLNGYGSFSQQDNGHYCVNFIDSAFSTGEQSAIKNVMVENNDNIQYGTEGGNDTIDKIFLLSDKEIYSAVFSEYGFAVDRTISDEARKSLSSTYAKAMGAFINTDISYIGNCCYWLRSPGFYSYFASDVSSGCSVSNYGFSVTGQDVGVRPALKLDILSDNWTNAGTVSTDGNVDELKYTVSYYANGGSGAPSSQMKYYDQTLKLSSTKPVRSGYTFLGWSTNKTATSVTYKAGGNYTLNKATVLYAVWKKNEKKSQTITASSVTKIYGDKPFYLKAKTNGNGKLSYSCSNKKVATISSSGKVSLKGYGSAKITVKASVTTTYKEAVKTVTVKVVPKKVKLKSLTSPSRKKIKFSWSKDKTVSGYQVYLCTRKDFKKNTLERTFGKNTVSSTISYMPQKKYYVKVRAYKTVGKKKYYGAWSDVKSVKIQ